MYFLCLLESFIYYQMVLCNKNRFFAQSLFPQLHPHCLSDPSFFFALFGSSQVGIRAVIFLAKLLVLNGECVNPVRSSVKVKALKFCKTHCKLGYASYESLPIVWVFNNSEDCSMAKPHLNQLH